MKLLKKILWLCFILFLLAVSAVFGYYYAVTKNVALRPEKLTFNEKSVLFYDHQNNLVSNSEFLYSEQNTKISDIPKYVQQAFVDVEDKRFYKHNGFDFKRICGATIHNVQAHGLKEGASTISQQLIKNTHLTQEKTFKRKLREVKLTRILEKRYTKQEILEKYLNTIYFGHNCFGITAAADYYFGKKVSELSLADGALLAGLVKSPNYYSPFRAPEKCLSRRNAVLNVMQRNGSITEEEKNEARSTPLPEDKHLSQRNYAYFAFEELTKIAEENQFQIGGKIEIFTYLYPDVQENLKNIAMQANDCDKSLFVLDNQTMGFKGCVSTVGNIARLPGSLIKPLLVYAPALEENVISPATPILDEKINYAGYSPENYDGIFHGYTSARECVARSLNVPAVKVLESVGVQKAASYMKSMRLPIEKDDESLALALGGMKKGYPLQDLASAYSAFANGGIYQKGAFIRSVKINGKTVYTRKAKPTRVFSEDSAYLMTDMLKTTATQGTAKKLRSLPFEIAAKTGTVGTAQGNTDAYAISYTKNDCVSVWLGNSNNEKIAYTGGGLPCNWLLQINESLAENYIHQGISIPAFTKPKDVVEISLDRPTYYDKHTMVLSDDNAPKEYRVYELFKSSAIPLNKSTSFSKPTIVTPTISAQDKYVTITFDPSSPNYYSYKILRTDYATHNIKTLFDGERISSYTDEDLQPNHTYEYSVVVSYKKNKSAPILLPTVSTLETVTEINKDAILEKNWWDY
ncbi:MAG: transglycosylase domain-containing protein [Clostridia bacterium]|nr:transglycosylase domain-containing protein [Clostridia bacterium]